MQQSKRPFISVVLGLACGLVSASGVQADAVSPGPSSWFHTVHESREASVRSDRLDGRALSATGVRQMQLEARAGQPNAQYAIGMLHAEQRDTAAALYWLHRAALQGHLPADYSYQAIMAADNHAELGW